MTPTLDKLYLEWSKFTEARNHRESQAAQFLANIAEASNDPHTVFKAIEIGSQLMPHWSAWDGLRKRWLSLSPGDKG